MKDYVAAAVLCFAPVVLIFVPWYEARARDGTTAAGHIFLFGLLLVGLGALCILLLGSSLHGVHRARLGREPARP